MSAPPQMTAHGSELIDIPSVEAAMSGFVRRSTRRRTGLKNLGEEELALSVELTESATSLSVVSVTEQSSIVTTKKTATSPAVSKRKLTFMQEWSSAKRQRVSRAKEGESVDDIDTPATAVNSVPAGTDIITSIPKLRAIRKRTTVKAPSNALIAALVPVVTRPEPHGEPPLWSESRQALCETPVYYRAYQSGAYVSGGLVHGFLLNHDATERAYMDAEVVVARAGGHCTLNEAGEMQQSSDHRADEPMVKSFRNNMMLKVPVVLIVGKQNLNCPTEIPHQYCVMDWFQVTDEWMELNNGKKCFKHRLEKLDLTTKSWWAPKGSSGPMVPIVSPKRALRKSCGTCRVQSTQIFEQSWMCLNGDCNLFWRMNSQHPPATLTYNPEFLKERTVWPTHIMPPHDLVQALPELAGEGGAALSYGRYAWKGVPCPNCKNCIPRRHWNRWECDTKDCGFVFQPDQAVLTLREVMDPHDIEYAGHALPRDQWQTPVILREPEFVGNWRVHTYDLGEGNTVTHYMANGAENRKQDGSNNLFENLQKDNALGLQRFPMKTKTGTGEVLAMHFALNYGMPYEYVVATDTKAFSDAPPAVMTALESLEWAAARAVEDNSFEIFNELLAVGYFQDSKMGFHDDGEVQLGPTVASLSLGGSAQMHVRMKERYFKGITRNGNYRPKDPVLPGCLLEEERKALNAQLGNVSQAQFEEMQKKLYEDKKKTLRKCPHLLTMELKHGDIVIQHGRFQQTYYEHSVIPSGPMRIGMTARFVKPELVDPVHHWRAERNFAPIVKDDITMVDAVTETTEKSEGALEGKDRLEKHASSWWIF